MRNGNCCLTHEQRRGWVLRQSWSRHQGSPESYIATWPHPATTTCNTLQAATIAVTDTLTCTTSIRVITVEHSTKRLDKSKQGYTTYKRLVTIEYSYKRLVIMEYSYKKLVTMEYSYKWLVTTEHMNKMLVTTFNH